MGPAPDVAAVRLAVRRALAGIEVGSVVVACSGGADSLALVHAAVFESRSSGHQVVGVVVDHGLQPGSAEIAERVVEQMDRIGVQESRAVRVSVGERGGPEAAARHARHDALLREADRVGAPYVLLGHTRDDQAETVLLGLVRGSGPRSLAGMASASGRFLRPLLDLGRSTTRSACAELGLAPWDDPHNEDDRFARVRVRHAVLPVLERELGPGVAVALARTARLSRQDADLLDALAEAATDEVVVDDGDLSVGALAGLPAALRSRIVRTALLTAGCRPTELTMAHVEQVLALVTDWHGQAGVDLPGRVVARRSGGTLIIRKMPVAG